MGDDKSNGDIYIVVWDYRIWIKWVKIFDGNFIEEVIFELGFDDSLFL